MRASGSRRQPTTGADPASATPPSRKGATRVRRRRRASTPRKRTWSAEHVPWWEDFRPGVRKRQPSSGASAPTAEDDRPNEFDVFDRSSGAAWSAAARRHFRRGMDDLPSRGVWRYRGTQVVTGAEARRVADEEEEKPPR
jgi:hypothetical protein